VDRHNATTEKPEEQTFIELNDPVSLTFALRYLNNFAKVGTKTIWFIDILFVLIPTLN